VDAERQTNNIHTYIHTHTHTLFVKQFQETAGLLWARAWLKMHPDHHLYFDKICTAWKIGYNQSLMTLAESFAS